MTKGSSQGPERKAAENNPAASEWNQFYRKIEVRGDGDSNDPTTEPDATLAKFSEEETEDILWKLSCLRHEYSVPRMLRSVLDQVFYVLESARRNLMQEGGHPRWRAWVALEMYQFYTALEEAARAARDIERSTGFSGEALYAEAGE